MASRSHTAEIVESSLTSWRAYAHVVASPPPFGSLITIPCPTATLYGFTTHLVSRTRYPTQEVYPYGMSSDELAQQHPEIQDAIITEASGIIIGYRAQNDLVIRRPFTPPPLHAHVHMGTAADYRHLIAAGNFLHAMCATIADIHLVDELTLAFLTEVHRQDLAPGDYLQRYAEWFLEATGNDYKRLKHFLHRYEPRTPRNHEAML